MGESLETTINVGWRKTFHRSGLHHFFLEDSDPNAKALCNSIKLGRTELSKPIADEEKCSYCLTKAKRLGITEQGTFIATFELEKVPRKPGKVI